MKTVKLVFVNGSTVTIYNVHDVTATDNGWAISSTDENGKLIFMFANLQHVMLYHEIDAE